jgi:hypothetical protein
MVIKCWSLFSLVLEVGKKSLSFLIQLNCLEMENINSLCVMIYLILNFKGVLLFLEYAGSH